MFDIGALELVVVAVVALVVVGPERLPRLARTAGHWVGRARRALVSVKDEIDREIKSEELREILRRQQSRKPLDQILEDVTRPDSAGSEKAHIASSPASSSGNLAAGAARTDPGAAAQVKNADPAAKPERASSAPD